MARPLTTAYMELESYLKGEPHEGGTDGSSVDGLLVLSEESFLLSIVSKTELETGVEGSRWRVGRGVPR